MKPKRYVHVTDSPITLKRGEDLDGEHIVIGGTLIGRVLFTELIGVIALGDNIITNNYIERL